MHGTDDFTAQIGISKTASVNSFNGLMVVNGVGDGSISGTSLRLSFTRIPSLEDADGPETHAQVDIHRLLPPS